MKKFYRNCVAFVALSLFSIGSASAQSDLVLTAAYDGPLTGGHPKGIEIYVINNIADLSIYGMGSANNGGGTDGEEFTFPAVAATAGSFIYIAADSTGFNNFFGFDADYIHGAANINGDDAIELFMNGTVVDVFGDINLDGTGQPWDHLDGWASRIACTGPNDSIFQLAEWTFSGINALDGETSNATAATPIPIGTYTTCTVLEVEFSSATQSVGENATTIQVIVDITNPDANATTVDAVLNVGSSTATNTVDFNVTSPQTLTFPGGSSTSQSFSFILTNDVLAEGNETIVFDLSNPTNGAVIGGIATHTITIIDDDIPTVEFNMASMTVDESAGTVNVMVDIINANASATSVDVILNGSSTATGGGTDFTFTSPTTVTFPAGSSASQMVAIPINDDALAEASETIILDLGNPTNSALIGTNASHTLTITDNDINGCDIADITSIDANGVADSIGVVCGIRGIVYGVNMRTSGLQFTVIDPTDGIGIINFTNDFGYTVTEGDDVEVRGTVGQFNGFTQMTADTVILLSSGNSLQAPNVVTALDEVTESDLVRINDVTLVDPLQWTNTGSGFNADVTDGVNTYTVRIDSEVDVFGLPAPTGTFDVCGLGGQFDSSSPYDSGYQLLPRTSDDIKIKVDLGEDTTVCGSITLDSEWANSIWSTSATTQTITVTTSGTYWVNSSYGTSNDADTIVVTVIAAPTSAFTAPDTTCATILATEFFDNSTGATSWSWDFGDGNTSTDQNPTHTYTGPGTFVVTLTVSNGTCTDVSTFNIFVNFCPSVEEFGAGEISVNPTLADEFVNLNFNLDAAHDLVITMTDISGRVVKTEGLGTIQNGTHTVQLDGLSGGLYLLNIEGEGVRTTFRVMVR